MEKQSMAIEENKNSQEIESLPLISKNTLRIILGSDAKSADSIFALPEKVLQFGTGVLLMGLPDYYIDKANKAGVFNGRIVMVKSTRQNKADEYAAQNCLYTQYLKGYANGEVLSTNYINSSISRVLDANEQWTEILSCARNPEMKLIFSNTTEVGIKLDTSDQILGIKTPNSFPGKLLAFLFERFKHFEGDVKSGMVIVPTELISDNGQKLKEICFELAKLNQLPPSFLKWLEDANDFCDSLVDRIVAGRIKGEEAVEVQKQLGYQDKLMIMSENYGLWAIKAKKPETKLALSFQSVDEEVVVADDITKYRQLKLYLLNSTHTFVTALALASGFTYVNEAMSNKEFDYFISKLLFNETLRAVINENISEKEAEVFAIKVLERFRNPFIQHAWTDISKQISMKMVMRCIPLIKIYQQRFGRIPALMTKGFVAYLSFLKTEKMSDGQYVTILNGHSFKVFDEKASILHDLWQRGNTQNALDLILGNTELWGEDLRAIPGFEQAVKLAFSEFEQTIDLNC